MKIGAFAARNQVGIDTVRHYIGLGLLLPPKAGKQYDFDAQCQSDFEEIRFLKSLGFRLTEIREIRLVRQLAKMTDFRRQERYQELFRRKAQEIGEEIAKLRRRKRLLEAELEKGRAAGPEKRWKAGIDLRALPLLRCDRCGGALRLGDAAVDDDRVLSGRLRCACGEEYAVSDGILYVGEEYREEGTMPDILTYIHSTDEDYLRLLDRSLAWQARRIDFASLPGRVLLEPGCGSGFFLRRIYGRLPEDAFYVAVDRDARRLRTLKAALENSAKRPGLLLICGDFARIPLRDRAVDVLCDISGTSNYGFDHPEFLPELLGRLLKPDAALIGSYILFENFLPGNGIPRACRPNFQAAPIREKLGRLGFTPLAEDFVGPVSKGGVYENYFAEGEKILGYSVSGKRAGVAK